MNFFYKHGLLSKNKSWSTQFDKWPFHWNEIFQFSLSLPDTNMTWFSLSFTLFGSLFNFVIDWDKKYDHAGFNFLLTLLSYQFIFEIHDVRHWNEEKDRWETEDDYKNT